RGGILPFSADQGLAAFDAALRTDEALQVPVRLDLSALRSSDNGVPHVLRGLVRGVPARRAAAVDASGSSLVDRLVRMPVEDRPGVLLELVRSSAAAVLGFSGAGAVQADHPFKEIGFDSLTAVELRNRLNTATGLRLPATLVFDYPTPEVLVRHLLVQLVGEEEVRTDAHHNADAVAPMGADEPIAIVGLGCRYPGGVTGADGLWDLLAAGKDAVGDFPTDRGWDLESLYDPDPENVGTSYT
ncbi:acyl carrier protein, partial [Nocardiopsis listeri]|uniref:acyl carrier protein n=1 Tax=Nocardiopsis listeri TaxID=53440 RepID=UPI000A4E94DA